MIQESAGEAGARENDEAGDRSGEKIGVGENTFARGELSNLGKISEKLGSKRSKDRFGEFVDEFRCDLRS